MDGVRLRKKAWEYLDDRLGLEPMVRLAKHKEVPIHRHSIWYYLGGMTLFLFGVQVVTGIMLLLYYRPSAGEAYESVKFIMTEVQFGWLIRSVHGWAANLLIFVLFIHLFSVLLLKAYRPPREFTWFSGMALFGLALGFGFTGYLLPWNELAFFATKVGTEIVAVLPVIGAPALEILRGGERVTGATLTRFFAVHVAILPALTIGVLGTHLYLVQKHGMSVPPGQVERAKREGSIPFIPDFALRDMVGWLLAVALVTALAAYIPAELGEKADSFASAPAGIKPEWYFMYMFQTLKLLPAHILWLEGELVGVMAFGLGGVVLLLAPILDRKAARHEKGPTLITWFALFAIVFIIVMTVVGYMVNPEA